MALINCKLELKLKWTKYCVLTAAGADNDNANLDDIIFTIIDTKLYVPVVTLSAKYNQKLSIGVNFLGQDLKHQFIGMNIYIYIYIYIYNKNTANEYRYFLESNFVGVNRLFVLIYLNRNNDVKRFNDRIIYQRHNQKF